MKDVEDGARRLQMTFMLKTTATVLVIWQPIPEYQDQAHCRGPGQMNAAADSSIIIQSPVLDSYFQGTRP
jgi:hypothetical protein